MLDNQGVILLAYIALSGGPLTHDLCSRFVGSYLANPPGVDCHLIVVCNNGPLPLETELLFLPLNASFLIRENDPSFDIGGYMDVAKQFKGEFLFCCGESVYFHKPGWLAKIAEVWQQCGPGMYGPFASNLVRPHLNTTCFACSPQALLSYPKPTNRKERYELEHGENALWRRLHRQGKPVRLVTWNGAWKPEHWRLPKNGLWNGDQSNCLVWANHTDRYRAAKPDTKMKWAAWADRLQTIPANGL